MKTWNLNIDTYRDKVMGCWYGKNIGGTLGTPVEGSREMHDVKFYLHDVNGDPLPNDDLDLQLIWLKAVEQNGILNVTPRLLGEYWVNYIIGPWNEYGVCAGNIRNGFYPPLSGSLNNEYWHASNGAWIRSEVWASMFPGSPAMAAHYAWMDACCDHCGDGIFAETFTSTLESAAYIESDLRKLIKIALAHIPETSRVARAVKLVCDCYDKGIDYRKTRELVVQDSADLGWFQAPANVAFTVLGLLYGEGDFEKAICYAVNCGDDSDCTGGTAGAVMGILLGASKLPEKWTKPIGRNIKTVAVNPYGLKLPETLEELTERVIRVAQLNAGEFMDLPRITDAPDSYTAEDLKKLGEPTAEVKSDLWDHPSDMLDYDLPYGVLSVIYEDGAAMTPGETIKLKFRMTAYPYNSDILRGTWHLPEGWSASAPGFCLRRTGSEATVTLTAGEFTQNVMYLPIDVQLSGRFAPIPLYIPVQHREGTVIKRDKVPNEHDFETELARTRAICNTLLGKD